MDGLDKGSTDNQITIRENMLIEDFLINPNKSERNFFFFRNDPYFFINQTSPV